VRTRSQLSPTHGRNHYIVAYMNGYIDLLITEGKINSKNKINGTNDSMQRKTS
jgi:hypothetical protein